MPAQKWWRYAHAKPSSTIFAAGALAADFIAAYDSAEPRLHATPANSTGMPTRNRRAPEIRCRIETIPGSGSRIRGRSRYTGRRVGLGRSRTGMAWKRFVGPVRKTLDAGSTPEQTPFAALSPRPRALCKAAQNYSAIDPIQPSTLR